MTNWPDKAFIVVDTETTGLSFIEDRIINLGVAVFHGGQYVHGWDWLINTAKPSAPEAVAVHKITDAIRWQEGRPAEIVMRELETLINRAREHKMPVVMFNAPFDMSMIRAEFRRNNRPLDPTDLYVIDPLVIDRHYQKHIPVFTKPHMRLVSMAGRYGVVSPEHRALADAKTTGYIAIGQSLHHSAIRPLSVMELHRRQEKWYEEWTTVFLNYAKKKSFEVTIPAWPYGDGLRIPASTGDLLAERKDDVVKS